MELTADDEIAAILAEPINPYSQLPLELRFLALGLNVPRRPPGRPRMLTFHQEAYVALRWSETLNERKRRGRSTQHFELRPTLRRLRSLRAKNALDWRIGLLSRKLDGFGRYSSTEILAPDDLLPDIDKAVADELGLTERHVRRIRSDPRMQPFMWTTWHVRDFERKGFEQVELRRLAGKLLTPERFAKGDLCYHNGSLVASGVPSIEVIAGPAPRHRVGCENFGIWRHRDAELGKDLPQVKFIPARKWIHFWPSVVAGWAGNSPTWGSPAIRFLPLSSKLGISPKPLMEPPRCISDAVRGGDPRPPVIAPKSHELVKVPAYFGYIRWPTFYHVLPDTVVLYPHSTWPYMRIRKPLWTPGALNAQESRLIAAIDTRGIVETPLRRERQLWGGLRFRVIQGGYSARKTFIQRNDWVLVKSRPKGPPMVQLRQ